MPTRRITTKREQDLLAAYATKSNQSQGRVHKEKEHPYRLPYQRDKDRITYSTAFRRLQYKTQVFVNYEGDHYRTRLTHTLEVLQISRTIARVLGLNEALAEAIALAHDIGHTPFGHAGEVALHDLMKRHGSFEHNRQALRIVDYLEERYPNFRGLNLMWETREGIIKHQTTYDTPLDSEFGPDKQPSLEAQVVNAADEIAYDNHDLDDGITSGLISMESLDKINLWNSIATQINAKYPNAERKIRRCLIIKELINYQVTDLIEETKKRLQKYKINSTQKVRMCPYKIASFSPQLNKEKKVLEKFLFNNLYMHPRVIRMSDKACRFINQLFNVYVKKPELISKNRLKLLRKDGKFRVICDYIAGMTDRFALDEYKKLFYPYERV